MIITTQYFELRNVHLNKTINSSGGDFVLASKFYSIKRQHDKFAAQTENEPWRIRLLSFRIWEETVDTDTGLIEVKLTKCPSELRNDSTNNDRMYTIAKIAAVELDIKDWS